VDSREVSDNQNGRATSEASELTLMAVLIHPEFLRLVSPALAFVVLTVGAEAALRVFFGTSLSALG
jgi:hypothetical protein